MPSISAAGKTWTYDLFATPDPRAIVICFHGWNGTKEQIEGLSGLHLRGAPIVVAYPQGKPTWFGLLFPGWDYNPGSKDVQMVAALIATLRLQFGPLPVHVAGLSEGGTMAYRAAAECLVARLAAVAAGLNPTQANHAPLSVLHIHGDSDSIVPFATYQPSPQAGLDLLASMGATVDLRMVPGGVHNWNPVQGYDSTGEILRAWGLANG